MIAGRHDVSASLVFLCDKHCAEKNFQSVWQWFSLLNRLKE